MELDYNRKLCPYARELCVEYGCPNHPREDVKKDENFVCLCSCDIDCEESCVEDI